MSNDGSERFTNTPGMPYEGSLPYVYVSYAHSDSSQVYPVIKWLMNKGMRVWYDEGIEGGAKWRDVVQNHVQDCAVFLPFVTINFCESRNCCSELFIAFEDGKVIIPIYLEKLDGSDLKNGIRTALPINQGIFKYEMPDSNTFFARLASFSAFNPTKGPLKSDLDDTLAGPDASALFKTVSQEIASRGNHPISDSEAQDNESNGITAGKNGHSKLVFRIVIAVLALAGICVLGAYSYKLFSTTPPSPPEIEVTDDEDTNEKADEKTSEKKEVTNDVGNLINGGYVIHDVNEMVYYARPREKDGWSTNEIVRRPIDGLQEEVVYSADTDVERLFHLNVLNNHLIFNHLGAAENSVVSLAMDDSTVKVIDTCDHYSLCQVDGGMVYYLRDGIIRRYDGTTKNYENLAEIDSKDSWRIYDKKLFVFEKGTESVKVAELTGDNSRECYHSKDGFVVQNMYPTSSKTIITLEENTSSSEFRVCTITTPKGNTHVLWQGTDKIERVCSYPEGVILTRKNGEQDYSILRVDNSGKETVIEDIRDQGKVLYTCQIDSYVYYVTGDEELGNYALHSYNYENNVRRQFR